METEVARVRGGRSERIGRRCALKGESAPISTAHSVPEAGRKTMTVSDGEQKRTLTGSLETYFDAQTADADVGDFEYAVEIWNCSRLVPLQTGKHGQLPFGVVGSTQHGATEDARKYAS